MTTETHEWTMLDSPLAPRMKPHRWLDAPYTDLHKLRVGDQVVRRTVLSILDTVRMSATELQASVSSLGVHWAREYYDDKSKSFNVYHHGICSGPNEIIEFIGQGMRTVDFATFGAGKPIYVVQYEPREYVFPRPVIAARARACLDQSSKMKWHRLYNNCDQWATYCSTGRLHSVAVDGIIRRVFRSILNIAAFGMCLGWRICMMLVVLSLVMTVICIAIHIVCGWRSPHRRLGLPTRLAPTTTVIPNQ